MQKTLFDLGKPETAGPQLNEAQRRAITHGDGPLLVIAGAGTGKTRVITERIRHLLESDASLLGENILGLTFTNKAAGEMKTRVVKAVGERGKDVMLATFHSFCETILKEVDPNRLAAREGGSLDPSAPQSRAAQTREISPTGRTRAIPERFHRSFSRAARTNWSPAKTTRPSPINLPRNCKRTKPLSMRTPTKSAPNTSRCNRKSRAPIAPAKKSCATSAPSPSTAPSPKPSRCSKSDAKRLRQLRERYKHILVDEFQDTNIAQLELLHLLSDGSRNIVVVGDNDQAIYRFRGASFGSFKLFLQRFTDWTEGQDSTPYRVSLTDNYRSTPNILRVATQAIGMNEVSPEFPKKVLHPNRPEGEKIRIVELDSPEAEATWVADELQRLHKAGRRWRDFAVLYRQHAHRDFLVEELSRRKIPFVISKLSILEHPLVRDVLAYLRLIALACDDIACARVLSAPAWHLDRARSGASRRARREKTRHCALRCAAGSAGRAAVRSFARCLPRSSWNFSEQRKTMRRRTAREILGDLIGMAGSAAARCRARPQIRQPACPVRQGLGTEKRHARPARISGVSGIFCRRPVAHSAWKMMRPAMPCN